MMNWKQIPQILSRYRNPQGQIPHQGAAPSITYKQKEIYKEKDFEARPKTDEEIKQRRALLKAQAAYLTAKYAKKAA